MESNRGLHVLKKIVRILFFIGLLYLFLVAISLMGGSFKLLGKGFAESLIKTTSNPFTGLLIGLLATSIIQSSSATTSMVVAMVSGGALSIASAVPIIMGANIGTTVTNALVSVGHISRNDEFERAFAGATVHDFFNLLAVALFLPLEMATGWLAKSAGLLADLFYGSSASGFGSPIKVIIKPIVNEIHHIMLDQAHLSDVVTGILSIVIAFIFIFIALTYMVKIMRGLVASKLESVLHKVFSTHALLTILIGIAVTAVIQSSSITTSLLVPLLGAGIITLEHAFPLTIGANIGTTITALIAALAGNKAGLTIAFVHMLFNISGAVVFYPIPAIRKIPLRMARWLAATSVKNKKVAFIFIGAAFFGVPLLLIFITKALFK